MSHFPQKSMILGALVSFIGLLLLVGTAGAQSPADVSSLLHWHQADTLGLSDGAAVTTWANDAPDDTSGYQLGQMEVPPHFGSTPEPDTGPLGTPNPPSFNDGSSGRFNGNPSVHFTSECTAFGGLACAGADPRDFLQYRLPGGQVGDKTIPDGLLDDPDFTMFVVIEFTDPLFGGLGSNPFGWGAMNGDRAAAFLSADQGQPHPDGGFTGPGMQFNYGGPNTISYGVGIPFNEGPKLFTITKVPGIMATTTTFKFQGEEQAPTLTPLDTPFFEPAITDGGSNDGVLMGFNGDTSFQFQFWDSHEFYLGEAIIYNDALSEEDENLVGSYLEGKYGLDTAYPDPGGGGTDADNDGDRDGNDYLILARDNPTLIDQWGLDYASLSAVSAVPEPGSLVLLGIALSTFGFVSKRRRPGELSRRR